MEHNLLVDALSIIVILDFLLLEYVQFHVSYPLHLIDNLSAWLVFTAYLHTLPISRKPIPADL